MHSIIAYLSVLQYPPSPLQHPLKRNTPKLIKNKAKQTHLAVLSFQHLLIHPSVIGGCSMPGSITFCLVAPPTMRSYVLAQGLWHTIIIEPSLKLLLDFLLLPGVLESADYHSAGIQQVIDGIYIYIFSQCLFIFPLL